MNDFNYYHGADDSRLPRWIPDAPPEGFDPRVARVLSDAQLQYELLENGDFVVPVSLSGGRRHIVVVHSRPDVVGTREIRHLFSCGAVVSGNLRKDTANRLLRDNAEYHLAAWQVVKRERKTMVIFSACVPADAPAADLLGTILDVAQIADAFEAETTGEDCL